MLQQETRTLYENSENYGAIPCFRDSLKYGMVKYFQSLPSFSSNTSLNVCKEWFRICSENYEVIPCFRSFEIDLCVKIYPLNFKD